MSEARDPRATLPSGSGNAARDTGFEVAATRPTVLIVDDVPYMLELASLFLARISSVVAARSGEEALELARACRPDVVVCDRRMPGMDGIELCRVFARERDLALVPFVMLIADDTGVERGQAIRAGAADVLSKPLSRVALIDTVRRLSRPRSDRSQPRIALDVPVSVCCAEGQGQAREPRFEKGMVRNLSRGGLFVEMRCDLAMRAEVDLSFRLPDSPHWLAPTAEVVWCRRERARSDARDTRLSSAGFGLRFLEIDASTSRQLEDYVFERTRRGAARIEPSTVQGPE